METNNLFNKNNLVWFTITIYNISMAVEAYVVFYPTLVIAILLLLSGAISKESNSLNNAFWSVAVSGLTYLMVSDYISATIFFILSLLVYLTHRQKINREKGA